MKQNCPFRQVGISLHISTIINSVNSQKNEQKPENNILNTVEKMFFCYLSWAERDFEFNPTSDDIDDIFLICHF